MEIIALFIVALVLGVGTDDGPKFILDLIYGSAAKMYSLAGKTFRFLRLTAIGMGIAYVVIFGAFILSLYHHSTNTVIGTGIGLVAIFAIIFAFICAFVPKTYVKLDNTVAHRPAAGMFLTVTVLPLPIIFYAWLLPWHLYHWALIGYGAFLLAFFPVVLIGKHNRSRQVYAPYAVAGILIISFFGIVLNSIFEQEIRSMVIARKIANRDNGRDNLAKETTLRSADEFTEDNVPWWEITTGDDGEPAIKKFTDSAKNRCYSTRGQSFMTKDPAANSVMIDGETYIPAFFADRETGEYVIPDREKDYDSAGYVSCRDSITRDRMPYVRASATTVGNSTAARTHSKSIGPTTISTNPKCVTSYPAGSCWTSANPVKPACPAGLKTLPSKATISPDGMMAEIIVSSRDADGVQAVDAAKKSLKIQEGDQYTIIASGFVKYGDENVCVGPDGMNNWYDPDVDSPFKDHVGGLEFSIGSLSNTRYLVGTSLTGTATSSGIPTFRVIERTTGFRDNNAGYHKVTIQISRGSHLSA